MEHKTFRSVWTKTDAALGIVEAIIAVMGNTDLGDDVIHPGAFTKTIFEQGQKVRVLDLHQTDSVMRVLGKPIELRELSRNELPPEMVQRYPKATGGLYAKTQYLMNTPEGAGAFARIAAGAIDEYSIGYDALDSDFSQVPGDGTTTQKRTVRNLRTIKLYEYSPVLWGMNPATSTLSAKTVSGAAGLPLADREQTWDGVAAEKRVRSWAKAEDAPNSQYRQAFFWYDGEAAENFTSYKLQFADVVDGKLTAIPRGIFAVAAALQGSRGGVNIPVGDKEGVKSKVAAYYTRMRKEFDDDSIVAPWENKSVGRSKPWDVFHEGEKWNVYKVDADGNPTGDRLGSFDTEGEARAQVRALYANEGKSISLTEMIAEVTEEFMELYGMAQYCMVTEVFDDHLLVCSMSGNGMVADDYYSVSYTQDANGEFLFAPPDQWISGKMVFAPEADQMSGEMKGFTPQTPERLDQLIKAGRVFASRNEARLRAILKLVNEALSEIDDKKPDNEESTSEKDQEEDGQKSQRARPTFGSPTFGAAGLTVELIDMELEEITLYQE